MGSSPEEYLLKTKLWTLNENSELCGISICPISTLPPQFCSILESKKPESRMETSSLAAPKGGVQRSKVGQVSSGPCSLKDCLQSFLYLTDRATTCSFLRNCSSKQTEMLNCCFKLQITVEANYRLTKKLKRKNLESETSKEGFDKLQHILEIWPKYGLSCVHAQTGYTHKTLEETLSSHLG